MLSSLLPPSSSSTSTSPPLGIPSMSTSGVKKKSHCFFQTTVFSTPRKCVRCCLESCLPLRQSRGVRLVNTFQLRFNKYCLCCRNLTLLLTLQRIEVFLSVAKKMVEWSEATRFKSKQKNDPFASHTFYLFQ